jgi:hypothetical protein
MKWLRRDPWSGAFSDLLEHHLGPACTKAGIEIGELADIIGNEWAATLWGCAFEDFLTREPSEVGNIIDDYLKRRGWNERAQNKAYMTGLRSSVMSLYEVSDVKSGESFMARDLCRDGEPVRITERTATRTLKQWDRIAARVVKVRDKTIIGGGVLPFDHALAETLLGSLSSTQKRAAKAGAEVLRGLDRGIGPAELDEAFDRTEVLRLAGPLISTIWLSDVLDKALNPRLPEVRATATERRWCSYPCTTGCCLGDASRAPAAGSAFRSSPGICDLLELAGFEQSACSALAVKGAVGAQLQVDVGRWFRRPRDLGVKGQDTFALRQFGKPG